jgi:hypothetical protein
MGASLFDSGEVYNVSSPEVSGKIKKLWVDFICHVLAERLQV